MQLKKIRVSGGGRDVPVRISFINYDPLDRRFQPSEFLTRNAPFSSGQESENTFSSDGLWERTLREMCPAPLQSGYSQQVIPDHFPDCTGYK
jgi:hypothetical protein